MLLSRKQITFSYFISSFLKSSLNLEHFQKKDDPHSSCVSKITASKKTWLDECLKSLVSDDPTKSNMVNAPKHCANLNDTSLPYLLITGKSIVLQKICLSDAQNLKTVS